jgi:Ca2+/Na+ antiporter
MWLLLCFASILAMSFISLLILFFNFITKIKKNENNNEHFTPKKDILPYKLKLSFICGIPIFLSFLGFLFFLIPLVPLLKFYESNDLSSLKLQFVFFMFLFLLLLLIALLYASVKRSLSWTHPGYKND